VQYWQVYQTIKVNVNRQSGSVWTHEHATAAEDCSTAALVAVTDSALPLHGIWTIIGNNKLLNERPFSYPSSKNNSHCLLLSKIYLTNNNNLKDRPISTVTVGTINFEIKGPLAFEYTHRLNDNSLENINSIKNNLFMLLLTLLLTAIRQTVPKKATDVVETSTIT